MNEPFLVGAEVYFVMDDSWCWGLRCKPSFNVVTLTVPKFDKPVQLFRNVHVVSSELSEDLDLA